MGRKNHFLWSIYNRASRGAQGLCYKTTYLISQKRFLCSLIITL